MDQYGKQGHSVVSFVLESNSDSKELKDTFVKSKESVQKMRS